MIGGRDPMDVDVPAEIELYPVVERWARKRFKFFLTRTNRGLKFGRIDVLGVRDTGGDLSGEIETVAIEVKRGRTPFAVACGQTLGYRVYVNRVYLADVRDSYSTEEMQIASNLGIGLIQIRRGNCREELSSPSYTPITKLNLELLEGVGLGRCQFCGCFFEIGEASRHRFSRLSRANVRKALESERGLMYWNDEVSERKNRLHPRRKDGGTIFERRFICHSCIRAFFADLLA